MRMASVDNRKKSFYLLSWGVFISIISTAIMGVMLLIIFGRELMYQPSFWLVMILIIIAALYYCFKYVADLESLQLVRWYLTFYNQPYRKYQWQNHQSLQKLAFYEIIKLLQKEEFDFYYANNLLIPSVIMVAVDRYDDVNSLIACHFIKK